MTPSAIMQMLKERVPLTLLLDLAETDPVSSWSILRSEPADMTWLVGSRRDGAAKEGGVAPG